MSRTSWKRRILVPFVAAVVACLATGTERLAAQTTKQRNADSNRYFKQLQARFNSWDLNGDGTLDKNELAKAFRGPDAKPYDYVPDPKTTPPTPGRELVTTTSWVLIGTPMSCIPVNLTLIEIIDLQAVRQVTVAFSPANPNTFPDYQFIVLAGTKGNPSLTRQEFETWAKTYAGANADQANAQRHITTATSKLQKAKGNKAKQAAQAELQRAQQSYATATAQLNAVPATIQAALALKR